MQHARFKVATGHCTHYPSRATAVLWMNNTHYIFLGVYFFGLEITWPFEWYLRDVWAVFTKSHVSNIKLLGHTLNRQSNQQWSLKLSSQSHICSYGQRKKESAFFRVSISAKRLSKLGSRSANIHADATYKLIWQGYPVLITGYSDANRQFHLISLAITMNEAKEDFHFIFAAVANGVWFILMIILDLHPHTSSAMQPLPSRTVTHLPSDMSQKRPFHAGPMSSWIWTSKLCESETKKLVRQYVKTSSSCSCVRMKTRFTMLLPSFWLNGSLQTKMEWRHSWSTSRDRGFSGITHGLKAML